MILEGAGEQPQPQTKQAEITAVLTVQPLHPLIAHGTDAQIDDPQIRQAGSNQQPTEPGGVAEMAFMDLKAATFQVREKGLDMWAQLEARISSGSSCHEGQYLTLLPIALPAAVQHQRSESCQGHTCLLAPLHPVSLLPAGHDQVVRLLHVPAADILSVDAPLPIVWNPSLARREIGDQGLQHLHVAGLWAIGLQHCNCARHVPAPQPSIQPQQQLRTGLLPLTDPTAEVGRFLMEVVPIENHGLVWNLGQHIGKKRPDPARPISNQQQCQSPPASGSSAAFVNRFPLPYAAFITRCRSTSKL